MIRTFGLIGYPLSHSFSPRYFAEKFYREGIAACEYRSFELEHIEDFPALLRDTPGLAGLNVTIPWKRAVMDYLDDLDEAALAIGAVNTIALGREEEGRLRLRGYNTDWIGFRDSLLQLLSGSATEALQALILGTGGSSLAVRYALEQLGIRFRTVSRTAGPDVDFRYAELDAEIVAAHRLIVNCTPLGMYPELSGFPDIPYEALGSGHFLFDLVYNPPKTVFLIKGEQRGARIMNGQAMLEGQAEAAWAIWTR